MSKRKSKEEWQIESDLKHNSEFEIIDEPQSGQHNVRILHKKCNNIISMKLNNHLKRYCKFCSNKNKKIKEDWQILSDQIHNSEFKILEEPKNGKFNVKILHIKCGNILSMTMNNHINHKNGCKKCSKYSLKSHQYWIDKCKDIWGDDYLILEEVSNVWQKVKVKHNLCGNILFKDMSNLIHDKRGCGECSKKNFGEDYIKRCLLEKNINFETQKKFDDLRNPKTGRKLLIDFWFPDFQVGLEVDGIQHRRPISHWGGDKDFRDQVYRDKIKNKYFKLKGLTLIRITNQELFKIKDIIDEYYNKEER